MVREAVRRPEKDPASQGTKPPERQPGLNGGASKGQAGQGNAGAVEQMMAQFHGKLAGGARGEGNSKASPDPFTAAMAKAGKVANFAKGWGKDMEGSDLADKLTSVTDGLDKQVGSKALLGAGLEPLAKKLNGALGGGGESVQGMRKLMTSAPTQKGLEVLGASGDMATTMLESSATSGVGKLAHGLGNFGVDQLFDHAGKQIPGLKNIEDLLPEGHKLRDHTKTGVEALTVMGESAVTGNLAGLNAYDEKMKAGGPAGMHLVHDSSSYLAEQGWGTVFGEVGPGLAQAGRMAVKAATPSPEMTDRRARRGKEAF